MTMSMRSATLLAAAALALPQASAFVPPGTTGAAGRPSGTACNEAAPAASGNVLDSFLSIFKNDDESSAPAAATNGGVGGGGKFLMARSLLLSLIDDERCFSTVEGAQKFADSCAVDVVYEDCHEPQPLVGRAAVADHIRSRVLSRIGGGGGTRDAGFRVDKISDGSSAVGFAWTWTSGDLEGLRGTTFVELNSSNEIQYVREIPEPLYKPGDLIVELLKAATAGAVPKPPPEYVSRTPREANEIAKYLFNEVQGADVEEAMRFFDENIVYRDFNYEDVLKGKVEVKKFIEDFSFPGITFATQRFDDGVGSTCFTWEVVLEGAPEGSAIKGISFYEVDPSTGLVTYVRDVPESGMKPPPLGKLARQFRPGVGVFQPVAAGSREGGM